MLTVSVPEYKIGSPTCYAVVVSNGNKSIQLWKRYSDFEEFTKNVLAETGRQLPVPLPPKKWWPGSSERFINDRRAELEIVLRAVARDEELLATLAVRDFLDLPKLKPVEASLADWSRGILKMADLISAARFASAAKRRTALIEATSLGTKLIELLAMQSKSSDRGFGVGELRRRQMQVEDYMRTVQQLNSQTRSFSMPANSVQAYPEEVRSASVSLFDGKSTSPRTITTSRVLGETDATRKLNNEELLNQQQMQMESQDEVLEQLMKAIRRQRQLGLAIDAELTSQTEMLEELDSDVHQVNNKLNEARRKVARFT